MLKIGTANLVIVFTFLHSIHVHHDVISNESLANMVKSMKYAVEFDLFFPTDKRDCFSRFGWQLIHLVLRLLTTNIEPMLTMLCKLWTESKQANDDNDEQISNVLRFRSIDNSRIGVSFARKRNVGGRRAGGGGGSYDRYSRGGGGDYDSSRYRRRYSPRQDDR